jgi:hypothetical protein
MMQEQPIRPHQTIKPKSKLVPVARQQYVSSNNN